MSINRMQLTAKTCGVFQISHFPQSNRVIVNSLLTAASTDAGVRFSGQCSAFKRTSL